MSRRRSRARKVSLVRLSEAEASAARAVLASRGAADAARAFGLCDERTLYKALAGESVSKLTAGLIRDRLPKLHERTIP